MSTINKAVPEGKREEVKQNFTNVTRSNQIILQR